MFVRRSLMVFALALSVARCADQPTAVQSTALPQPAGPQFLKWSSVPEFSARIRPRRSGAMTLTPPLSLESYSVSFWAVRGESRSVQINYASSIDTEIHPFLQITTTDPQFVPGVGELAVGDSVLITVSVDTTKIGVVLEPSGLQFGDPAEMKIWYGGASGDLNGDGVADSTDVAIEQQLLGLWYREDANVAWTQLPAGRSVEEKLFTYGLQHFSEYAVALDWSTSW